MAEEPCYPCSINITVLGAVGKNSTQPDGSFVLTVPVSISPGAYKADIAIDYGTGTSRQTRMVNV